MICNRKITTECTERNGEFEPKAWNIRQNYKVCPDCHRVLCKESKARAAAKRAALQVGQPTLDGITVAAPPPTRPRPEKKATDSDKQHPFTQSAIERMVRGMEAGKPTEIFDFTNDAFPRGNREIGVCPECNRRCEISISKLHTGSKMFVHLAATFEGKPRTIDYCMS